MAEENKDYYSRQIDEAKQWEALYQRSVQELKTESHFQTYLSHFTPDSVESFITFYATQKVNWYRYGNVQYNHEKRKHGQWYKLATKLLIAIQRKKVFDVIIRWGNYELEVPEARSHFDFNKWLCNPFACPYITLVHTHETDIAVRFLDSLDSNKRLVYQSHDDFNINTIPLLGLPDMELDEYDYPLFFRYWDKEYGNRLIRKLPARIEKEENYVDTYREYKKLQELPEPETKPKPEQKKPALAYYDRKIMDAFVEACEPAEYKRMYELQKWWQARNSFSEMVEREIGYLSGSPMHLPVESDDDWREAIARTAEQYTRQQVAECVPLVYREYEKRLTGNNDFTDWAKDNDFTKNPWYPKYLHDLLEGRKLMNEPADFNY